MTKTEKNNCATKTEKINCPTKPEKLNCASERWARYFPKVLRYRYLLEKSTVCTGTGTIFKNYRGTGTRYQHFLTTQLSFLESLKNVCFKKFVIYSEKKHDKPRCRPNIYFEKNHIVDLQLNPTLLCFNPILQGGHFCPTLDFFVINTLKKTIFFKQSQISSQLISKNFKL